MTSIVGKTKQNKEKGPMSIGRLYESSDTRNGVQGGGAGGGARLSSRAEQRETLCQGKNI